MLTHYGPSKRLCQHSNVLRHHYKSNVLFFIICYFFPVRTSTHKLCIFKSTSDCISSLCAHARGPQTLEVVVGGAESKLKRMDWYSAQTAGMLLKASFKPNVHRPLKSARTSLLNQKPTSGCVRGLHNYWLAGSQTRWRESGDVDTLFLTERKVDRRLTETCSFVF